MPTPPSPDAQPGHPRLSFASRAAVVCLAVVSAACSTWSGFTAPHPDQVRERPEITLGAEASLKLHLSRPASGEAPRAILLHVTGDSGWHGLDTLYFDAMASRGYALAGVSARALRADLHSAGTGATPARLAADYLELIDTARRRLELRPDTPVVVTGLSRGAGLGVVAGSQPELTRHVAGIVVMGLTADEGNVRPTAAPFSLIDRVARPLVVIQSTVDRHVPAAEARRLFGADTASRKLVPVQAESHTFVGNREELFRQVEAGIEWILSENRKVKTEE